MLYLKEDTDTEVVIGPFLDGTTGVDAETGLTISAADIRLKKGAADWAAATNGATHEENGWYRVTLSGTSDINDPGRLVLAVHEAGALPVWHEFMVLPAQAYDSLVAGSDKLDVNVAEWLGTAAATPSVAGVPEVDVTHWKGSVAPDNTGDAYARLGAPAGASVSADLADVEGKVDDLEGRLTAPRAALLDNLDVAVSTRSALTAAQVNTEVDTALADYDGPTHAELVNEVNAVQSDVAALNNLSAAGVRTAVGLAAANLDTQLSAIDDFLDTEIAAIKAKTDNLPASPAAVGSAMTLAADAVNAAAVAASAVTEIQSGLSTLDAAGVRAAVGLASASLDTQLDALPTAAENAAGLLDLAAGVETGLTVRQAMRLFAAALAGKLSGAATTTITIRNTGDDKNRITAQVDANGNRSSVTYDLT